ncbi:MAG: hypothetical protein FWE03_00260 [Firmicutes bacterium]|nr:hypothetical protein [Bacillota bacterium]
MQNPSIKLRDAIIKALKEDKEFADITAVETNGFLVALADIAMPDKKGEAQAFRIAIVPYKPDYSKFT